MKLRTRISSSDFIEITVDEIETTIFKSDKKELSDMIENLLSVIEDIEKLESDN